MAIQRGEIYSTNLLHKGVRGVEVGKIRPAEVVQANEWNNILPTTIIVPFTSRVPGYISLGTVSIKGGEFGLGKDSSLLFSQMRSIDKSRLKKKIGKVSDEKMKSVDKALSLTLGLESIE